MQCVPGNNSRIIDGPLMVRLNTWRQPAYRKLGVTEADLGMFEELLERMFQQPMDRKMFLDWGSWCLQHEAEKPGWSPFLYSQKKGTGKSTLCGFMGKLFGEDNTITQNSVEKLTARFNQPILTHKLIICEELKLKPGSTQGNTLKTFITESSISTERKGVDVEKMKHCGALLFTSNHRPQWIERDEQRFLVIDTEHSGHASGSQADEFSQLIAEFRAWSEYPKNVARVYNALIQRRQNNSFNPHSLNLSLIDTPVMREIASTVAEVTLERLDERLDEDGRKAIGQKELADIVSTDLKMNANRLNHVMPELGWTKVKAKWGGRDHARALWVKTGYVIDRGRVRGPDGFDHLIDDQPQGGEFTLDDI